MMEIGVLTADPAKIARDLADLVACFRQVLEEAGQPEVAACLPWRGNADRLGGESEADLPAEPSPSPELLAQASSIAFMLLTLVEQNATAQYRRGLEDTKGPDAVPSLWAAALQELRQRGVPEQDDRCCTA
jgi:phosphoenolpyruvate carboxylase